jgi:hypothetical protein
MDPLDPAPPSADGLTCAVCDGSVPIESVRLLASRDDLAFLELRCADCRSTTLAFVLAGSTGRLAPVHAGAPVTTDDVLDMHRFLARWQGGLRELVAGGPSEAGPAS